MVRWRPMQLEGLVRRMALRRPRRLRAFRSSRMRTPTPAQTTRTALRTRSTMPRRRLTSPRRRTMCRHRSSPSRANGLSSRSPRFLRLPPTLSLHRLRLRTPSQNGVSYRRPAVSTSRFRLGRRRARGGVRRRCRLGAFRSVGMARGIADNSLSLAAQSHRCRTPARREAGSFRCVPVFRSSFRFKR